MKIATTMKVCPKRSACAIRARAMTAPERIARNMLTRPSDSWYASDRAAIKLQCSVARICSFSDTAGSRGGSSVTRQVSGQVVQGCESFRRQEGGDAVVHLGDGAGVHERGGAHLHSAAAGDQEFKGVL